MDTISAREKVKIEDLNQQVKYRNKLLKSPQLQQLFIELTDRCNLACVHCGSNCSSTNYTNIDTDLLEKTLKEVAEDFSNKKPVICFTGGEPLLHPDFEKIVTAINNLSFSWGITTNATLINYQMAKKLKELKMGSISISIDGLRETHNKFRGAKIDNYQQTIDAINYLQSVGLAVQVTTVVHKNNFHELEELYQEMLKLKIYSWRVVNIDPIGRALSGDSLLLNKEQLFKMFDFIKEKRFEYGNTGLDVCYGCSHYLTTKYERDIRDHCFMCGAGIFIGSILCNGDIYSCLDIERRPKFVQGNIAKDRFFDVWTNKFKEFRENRAEKCEMCRNCSEKEFCNGDSMHTWDFDNNEPRLCVKNLR